MIIVGLIVPLLEVTPAHDQSTTHRYTVHFPEHLPRAEDPNYPAFAAYHRATEATAKCFIGQRVGLSGCVPNLELHHAHLEFSLLNGYDLAAINVDYPDLKDDAAVQKWAESQENFRWLCVFHHRGHGGAHVASHSDWEASQYELGLIT